jgi:hypothetical protein
MPGKLRSDLWREPGRYHLPERLLGVSSLNSALLTAVDNVHPYIVTAKWMLVQLLPMRRPLLPRQSRQPLPMLPLRPSELQLSLMLPLVPCLPHPLSSRSLPMSLLWVLNQLTLLRPLRKLRKAHSPNLTVLVRDVDLSARDVITSVETSGNTRIDRFRCEDREPSSETREGPWGNSGRNYVFFPC